MSTKALLLSPRWSVYCRKIGNPSGETGSFLGFWFSSFFFFFNCFFLNPVPHVLCHFPEYYLMSAFQCAWRTWNLMFIVSVFYNWFLTNFLLLDIYIIFKFFFKKLSQDVLFCFLLLNAYRSLIVIKYILQVPILTIFKGTSWSYIDSVVHPVSRTSSVNIFVK